MRPKKLFLSRLREGLDLPREMLVGGFSLSMFSAGELCVCGCRRILEYGEGEIRLLVGKRRLCIEGQGLLCASFSPKSMTVTGEIRALRFEEAVDAD